MAERNRWSGMESLRREIDRAFEDFGLRSGAGPRAVFLPGRSPRGYPLINLYEDQNALYVEALAPGVHPDALELSVVGNTLTIGGEKHRVPGDVEPEAFHRSERAAGKFVRTVELPVEIDADQIKAAYRNGLLTITLPKAEQAKPRQISVQVD